MQMVIRCKTVRAEPCGSITLGRTLVSTGQGVTEWGEGCSGLLGGSHHAGVVVGLLGGADSVQLGQVAG